MISLQSRAFNNFYAVYSYLKCSHDNRTSKAETLDLCQSMHCLVVRHGIANHRIKLSSFLVMKQVVVLHFVG